MASNLYTLPYKQQQIKYMHQTFFAPPHTTLSKVIDEGHLKNIPFMTRDNVMKFLAKNPATSKGGMKCPWAGIRSTKNTQIQQETPQTTQYREGVHVIHLDDNHATNHIFCYAALADKKKGTLYTDAMGALPTRTLDGHQYYFIAYNYDSNYIFATPIKDTTDTSILTAFKDIFEELKDKGHKPTFNITDNQAAKQIKWYLKQEESEYQSVEPKNHQVNAAEWAIQSFKITLSEVYASLT